MKNIVDCVRVSCHILQSVICWLSLKLLHWLCQWAWDCVSLWIFECVCFVCVLLFVDLFVIFRYVGRVCNRSVVMVMVFGIQLSWKKSIGMNDLKWYWTWTVTRNAFGIWHFCTTWTRWVLKYRIVPLTHRFAKHQTGKCIWHYSDTKDLLGCYLSFVFRIHIFTLSICIQHLYKCTSNVAMIICGCSEVGSQQTLLFIHFAKS